mmetsp:Transcript_154977/g.496708  ORF Transcript_154977/g.496708 Transcript_154977/m.496708 type:complete len:261 (+) Transcript_154977:222-1004(+)
MDSYKDCQRAHAAASRRSVPAMSNAVDDEVGVCAAKLDEPRVGHVVEVGSLRSTLLGRRGPPCSGLGIGPRLEVPGDEPLALRRDAAGGRDEPRLVEEREQRRPAGGLISQRGDVGEVGRAFLERLGVAEQGAEQQVVALDEHDAVVGAQHRAARHRVRQLPRVHRQLLRLATRLSARQRFGEARGVEGVRRATAGQEAGSVGRVEPCQLCAAVVEAVHRQHCSGHTMLLFANLRDCLSKRGLPRSGAASDSAPPPPSCR